LNARRPDLVIFDCDGVLVDSEPLANAVLAEALTAEGLPTTLAESVERYTGLSMRSVVERAEASLGRALPFDFVDRVQAETFAAFRRDLHPVPGVREVLEEIDLPVCVASSGALDKIALSLSVTDLDRYFDGHIFSATMVPRGKPFPDLFLHAAAGMGMEAGRCAVIEDSVPGVRAAAAAGMRVLGYAGGDHGGESHARRLADLGATPFFDMAALTGLLFLKD